MKLEYIINNGNEKEITDEDYKSFVNIMTERMELPSISSYKNLALVLLNNTLYYHMEVFEEFEAYEELFEKIINKLKNLKNEDDYYVFIGMSMMIEIFKENICKEYNIKYDANFQYINCLEYMNNKYDQEEIYQNGMNFYTQLEEFYQKEQIQDNYYKFLKDIIQVELVDDALEKNSFIMLDYSDNILITQNEINELLEQNIINDDLVHKIGVIYCLKELALFFENDGLYDKYPYAKEIFD